MLYRRRPGITTGIAVAYWDGTSWLHAGAYQCDAGSAVGLVSWILEANEGPVPAACILAAVEEFRPGTGAGARGPNAKVTRDLVRDLVALLEQGGITVHVRPAATVKPWAGEARLRKAGFFEICHGMPHALDGFRHLVYAAVHDGGVSDPLSRRGKDVPG